MVEKAIIQSVKRYLNALLEEGLEVSFGVLFGSQVTGKTHEWSDIDVVVVSPVYDGDCEHKEIARLWGVAGLIDSRIEPVHCGLRQWKEDDQTPIIEIARREGVIVKIDEEEVEKNA